MTEFQRNKYITNHYASSGHLFPTELQGFSEWLFSCAEHAAGRLNSSSIIEGERAESTRHTVTDEKDMQRRQMCPKGFSSVVEI